MIPQNILLFRALNAVSHDVACTLDQFRLTADIKNEQV
jgi:hypothetical protein